MNTEFQYQLRRTLAYFEIFDHALTVKEMFALYPKNSITEAEFRSRIDVLVDEKLLVRNGAYYYRPAKSDLGATRSERTEIANRRIRVARFMAWIISLFPFVRGVFVSGDLSKGVATAESDIDYLIVTKPGRLWICRTLLIMFKKTVLLNRKKYFCLNYFISEDHLELTFRNYYTATEVATVKPLVNFPLFLEYMNANIWVKEYFPNFTVFALDPWDAASPSRLSRFFGLFFAGAWAGNLDTWLMERMRLVWKQRYPEFDAATLAQAFACTKDESRAFGGNYSQVILDKYANKLKEFSGEENPTVIK